MKRIFLFLLFIFPLIQVAAADSKDLSGIANEDYKAGKYAKAAETYEKIIGSGYESVETYYNLGNAYFKLNKLPEAILYYEKARKLSPGDEDINYNLKVANSKIVDKIDILPELFYVRYWKTIISWFSVDQWAKLSIVFFCLFFVLAGLYLYSRRQLIRMMAFWTAVAVFLLTVLTFSIAVKNYNVLINQKEAVVFTPALTVKSSPDEGSVDLFVLHEGTKVIISDNLGTWTKITISNGSVGWVPSSELKLI
jgi:tetratricopeptide (TPR) repeat protein